MFVFVGLLILAFVLSLLILGPGLTESSRNFFPPMIYCLCRLPGVPHNGAGWTGRRERKCEKCHIEKLSGIDTARVTDIPDVEAQPLSSGITTASLFLYL